MKKIREILLFSLCVLLFSGSLTAAAADGAPIAENLEIMTYRGISVGGQLKAFDPEGEEVHFRITTEPRKGTLTLEENGEFVYTPAEGKRGRDYFGYCASDPNGNVSQEATVVITIRKAGKGAGYADTAGLSCEYAACVLAEEGLFTGRCVCGQYLFEPEETVSCGEFLSLCMETAGIEPVETTVSAESSATAAPVWIQQYVDAAVSEGCPVPTFGGASFDADAPVTLGAAAQTLSKALRITPLSSASGEESAAAARHTGAGGVRSSAGRNGCGSVSHARSGGGAFPKGAPSFGTARLTKNRQHSTSVGCCRFWVFKGEKSLVFSQRSPLPCKLSIHDCSNGFNQKKVAL